ncbi:GCN5 family acetyltransferase [Sphingomonas sp. Leaf25]|nr:GCN5 family acetyltransferase [Sphingomonas sp. Leaf25]
MGGGAMIRVATIDDIAALHDLVEAAFRGDSARTGWTHEADLLDGQRTDRAALSELVGDPARRMLVAEAEGRMIGCVALSFLPDGRAALGMLAVRPDLQGGGTGRALVAAAEHAAAAAGAGVMEMTVIAQRGELIAWYERQGYRRTGGTRPFPLDDPRFGLPRTRDLYFVVLDRALAR